ncbi:MAG: hypothetical protein U1A04_11950 [Moraxellaceae bacterium]|nr:hypothetical protein [Moraxellaceae bacterium]
MQTMMADSMALNKIGAKQAGIRILFSCVWFIKLGFILSKKGVLPSLMRISPDQKRCAL